MEPSIYSIGLKAVIVFALPLSFPVVFAAFWFGTYKLVGKSIPVGATKAFWVWLTTSLIVIPFVLGYLFLVSIGGHFSDADVYPPMIVAALVWLSIVPILLYKTAVAACADHGTR